MRRSQYTLMAPARISAPALIAGRGQALVEYALILAMVSLLAVTIALAGRQTSAVATQVDTNMTGLKVYDPPSCPIQSRPACEE